MTDREEMRQAWLTLSVVVLASLLVGLAGSALNVALPTVVRHFEASSVAGAWILLGYMLANASMLMLFGRLSDRFGRRRMYLQGLVIYTTASLLCGLAPGPWWLVLFRVIQAAGGAMLLTNSAALVTAAFPRRRLGEGMGIYLASFSVAQLMGPALGGMLAEGLGWQWVFWFNVPVGLVCLIWGWIALKAPPVETSEPRGLDPFGNALVLVILGTGLAAVSQSSSLGWGSPVVLVCGSISFACVPLFIWHERRARFPVVEFSLLSRKAFSFGLAGVFLNTLAQSGLILLVSLYFQAGLGRTPVQAGAMILPLAIAAVFASTISGPLQRVVSASDLAIVGVSVKIVGLTGLLLLAGLVDTPTPALVGLAVVGLGTGLFTPSNTTALLREVPDDSLGSGNALRMLVQTTGMVIGTAGALVILTSQLPLELRHLALAGTIGEVSDAAAQLLIHGYQWTLGAMLAVAIAALAATIAVRQVRERGER